MANDFEGFDFFLSQVKHNLKDVTEFAFNFLTEQYADIIQHTDELLLQAARETEHEDEKALLITAIDECQRSRQQMQASFAQHLITAFQPLTGERIVSKPSLNVEQSSVNLVSDDDLDDRIQVQTIIAHARGHFEKWLDQITAALQSALPGVGITPVNNPYGPNSIGDALFESVQVLGMGTLANKQIFTIFQRQLFHQLEPFYRQVLGRLSQAGINAHHPGSSMAATHVAAAKQPVSSSSALDHRGFNLDTVAEEPFDANEDLVLMQESELAANEWDAIHLIQDANIPGQLDDTDYIPMEEKARMEPHVPVSVLSRHAIDELLGSFQKGYDPESDGDLSRYVEQQLALETSAHSRPILQRDDENIIHLIGLVFNQIAEQQNPQIANLFYRLKLPYVRLALTDELFFHDHLHPARQLLDKLLQLINGSHDDKELFKQVHFTVMKIQLRYHGNPDIFDELLGTVESYIQQESRSININHSAQTKTLEAEENQRLARQAAGKLIGEHMQALHHRLAFHDLLEQFWQDILANIYLQKGADSQSWKTAIYLLDILIISTGSKDLDLFRKYTKEISRIARNLNQFLMDHQVAQENKQLLLDQLQELQILFVRGNTPADITDDMLSFTDNIKTALQNINRQRGHTQQFSHIGHEHRELANGGSYALAQAKLSAEQAKQLVEQMAIGQWMSFVVDRKEKPAQAGFYSKSQQSYVFFDRQHNQLFERSKQDLYQDVVQGYAGILESTLSFDGALAAVNAKLKKSHAFA